MEPGGGGIGVVSSAIAQNGSWSTPENLGPQINTASTDGCPFISADDLQLFFASNRPGGAGGLDLYYSTRESTEGPWSAPIRIAGAINDAANDFCPMLTRDGHWLYFVSERAGGCGGQDLYRSYRADPHDPSGWGEPANLGCTINSAFNDYTPSIFKDGPTERMYFSSNRPGGIGGADIYLSTHGPAGWGPGVLVDGVNTAYDDQRPNVRHNGKELFFDSNRPGSSGYDIWSAVMRAGAFLTPQRLDVNTAGNEGRPSISHEGTTLYFMSNRTGGFGGLDLYRATRAEAD